MDGLLIVDKPAGPTSHDVVARVRRALGERRIGHTGTLDPAATGVLPLVLGRATRLARFLSASDKSYDAVFRLGVATDTNDAEGTAAGPAYQGPLPSRDAIDRALDRFRGTFLQQPPAYSAKKVAGRRSYRLAREAARSQGEGSQLFYTGAGAPPGVPNAAAALGAPPPARTDADASPETARHGRRRSPEPVSVATQAIDLIGVDGDRVTLRVDCSAGFYVRALAHDLGAQLGCGAHLLSLRRTRSGDATLDQALVLDAIERDPARAVRAVVPLSQMLPGLSSVMLTSEGVRHAVHGRDIGPADAQDAAQDAVGFGIRGLGFGGESQIPNHEDHTRFVRLLDPTGELVGIASLAGASGLLHPAVVLM
jgi:tRNA pseudouridine55 synthase